MGLYESFEANRQRTIERLYKERRIFREAIEQLGEKSDEWCIDASELRLGGGDDETCFVQADQLESCASELNTILRSMNDKLEALT